MSSPRDGNPHYNPGNLLDTLQRVFGVKNDRQLAKRLNVTPPLLCKIRGAKIDPPSWLIIHLNEETNFTVREIRALRAVCAASIQCRAVGAAHREN